MLDNGLGSGPSSQGTLGIGPRKSGIQGLKRVTFAPQCLVSLIDRMVSIPRPRFSTEASVVDNELATLGATIRRNFSKVGRAR